jgi:Icc-related predicted phosphoesterase
LVAGLHFRVGDFMGIVFLGDLHGEFRIFDNILSKILEPTDVVIQVGDFGIYPDTDWKTATRNMKCPVFFIDGNHENFDIINKFDQNRISEVAPQLYYVPRGTVADIQGRRIGFMGGAPSIDKHWRTARLDWFPEEVITLENVDKLISNVGDVPLDILVTHAAPTYINLAHFGKLDLDEWRLPYGWVDECSNKVEFLNTVLNPTLHVCGHMHRNIRDGNIKIVDIAEMWSPGSPDSLIGQNATLVK